MKKASAVWLAGWLLLTGINSEAQDRSASSGQTTGVPANAAPAQHADPAVILAQAKQASGGSAWDGIRTLHLHALSKAGGLNGVVEEWTDVLTGRSATRFSRPPVAGASGFDGVSAWTQDAAGYSYVIGDEDARQGAVDDAYRRSLAFWFPERGDATLASGPSQKEREDVRRGEHHPARRPTLQCLD